jgi:hypothetical protein
MDWNDPSVCPECGAAACREKYGKMLALEFEDPAIFGTVHHITVTCYNLQHPGVFTDEAIAWMRSSLRVIIVDGLSAKELRERARKMSGEGIKIKRHAEPREEPARVHWSMTVTDIRTDNPEAYHEDIIKWARSILKNLNVE